MRERSYRLDPKKCKELNVADIMRLCDVTRQSAYMWKRGKQGITETNFRLLSKGLQCEPVDLLSKESMAFLARA